MIKKYGLNLLAVVIALGAVAFKKDKAFNPPPTSHTFYYQAPGTNPYSETNVESKANWISNPGTVPDCDGSAKACQMSVDDTYTEIVNNVRVFKTSGSVATIDAIVGSGSNYVPTTAGSSVGITAKADKP